jgi:hypothetical protein
VLIVQAKNKHNLQTMKRLVISSVLIVSIIHPAVARRRTEAQGTEQLEQQQNSYTARHASCNEEE